MKILKSQQGYTMLITITVVMIFSILGISLLYLATNGAMRSESRESNTQALRLATKGEEFLLAKMKAEIEHKIENGVSPDQFKEILEETIGAYKCDVQPSVNSPTDSTYTGAFEACIAKAEPIAIKNPINENDPKYNEQNPFNPYQQYITIRSIGESNSMDKAKTVESQHLIGKDLNLELYEFAISSRGSKESSNDGNMYLSGQLDINGNVYVGNKLETANKAKYYTKTIESNYPKANPFGESSIKPTFILNDSITDNMFLNGFKPNTAKLDIDLKEIDVQGKIDEYAETFKDIPTTTFADLTKLSIEELLNNGNIESLKTAFYAFFDSAARAHQQNYEEKMKLTATQNSHKKIVLSGKTCFNSAMIPLDIVILYEEEVDRHIPSNSCLDRHGIKQNDKNESIIISDKGLYTPRDMHIGHKVTMDDSPEKPTIQLKGNFYVENNLYITNAEIDTLQYTGMDRSRYKETEANFYVGGDVYILWTEFRNSNINIYAEGDIHFINVSDTANVQSKAGNSFVDEDLYSIIPPSNHLCADGAGIGRPCENDFPKVKSYNKPSFINGLIYSNKQIASHTASSNITFNGGLSAKEINLSSISGQIFKNNDIHGLLPIYVYVGAPDKNSYIRYITREGGNFYKTVNNRGSGILELGVQYCIPKNKSSSNMQLAEKRDCNDTDWTHAIADELYRFPTKAVQENFSSRIKINQPKREELLPNRMINSLDPSRAIERITK